MLNFLIAVISQSYENVMNSKDIKKYKQIAELNLEAFRILTYIGYFNKEGRSLINNNKLLLTLKHDEEGASETEEWIGFVQTIKIFIKKQLHHTQDSFTALSRSLKGDIKSMDAKIEERMDNIEKKMD